MTNTEAPAPTFSPVSGRDLVVGSVIMFGDLRSNAWRVVELRDHAPDGTPYDKTGGRHFRGATFEFVGDTSVFPMRSGSGPRRDGSVRGGSTYLVFDQLMMP